MRLIIFTNRDLASNYNLNLLLPELSQWVKHIFISDQVGKPNAATPDQLKSLKFFEQILPNEILFPLIEQSTEHTQHKKLLTFNEISKHYNIPVESLNDVRTEASLRKISALKPDLILSVRYGKIFGKEFLKIPPLGVINLHSGKLPEYRGVLAVFRALMNNDTSLFTTLHFIDDPSIDTGRIIAYSETPVRKNHALLQHILELYPAASRMVIESIKKFANGQTPESFFQQEQSASYFTFPDATVLSEFERRGWKLTDTEFYTDFIRQYQERDL